jgi:hypothetical protein
VGRPQDRSAHSWGEGKAPPDTDFAVHTVVTIAIEVPASRDTAGGGPLYTISKPGCKTSDTATDSVVGIGRRDRGDGPGIESLWG